MDKLLQMMGLARRANLLLAGEEVVADAIAAHKARLVLLAADASERTGKKIRQMAGETLPVLVLPAEKDALGAALGKGAGWRLCRQAGADAGTEQPGLCGGGGAAEPEGGQTPAPEERKTSNPEEIMGSRMNQKQKGNTPAPS